MFKSKDYVLAICREGSFTKAAERLFVSQPSLSATVKRLEEKIGSPIFDRSCSPITLTEVGKKYVECARAIEQKEDEFMLFSSDYQNLLQGKIRLGGTSFFSSFILPEMISSFNKKHPKIELEIRESGSRSLKTMLLLGDLDIIIDNSDEEEENIAKHFYSREQLLLAVPNGFEISRRFDGIQLSFEDVVRGKHKKESVGIPINALKNHPFVLQSTDNDTGSRAEKLLKKYGVDPKILFHLDQQITAYNVCVNGLGITFASDTLIKKIGKKENVSYYKIDDSLSERNIYLCHKKNHYLSLAAKKFIEYHTE